MGSTKAPSVERGACCSKRGHVRRQCGGYFPQSLLTFHQLVMTIGEMLMRCWWETKEFGWQTWTPTDIGSCCLFSPRIAEGSPSPGPEIEITTTTYRLRSQDENVYASLTSVTAATCSPFTVGVHFLRRRSDGARSNMIGVEPLTYPKWKIDGW